MTWQDDRTNFTKTLYKHLMNEGPTVGDVVDAADRYAEAKAEAARESALDDAARDYAYAHYEDD